MPGHMRFAMIRPSGRECRLVAHRLLSARNGRFCSISLQLENVAICDAWVGFLRSRARLTSRLSEFFIFYDVEIKFYKFKHFYDLGAISRKPRARSVPEEVRACTDATLECSAWILTRTDPYCPVAPAGSAVGVRTGLPCTRCCTHANGCAERHAARRRVLELTALLLRLFDAVARVGS